MLIHLCFFLSLSGALAQTVEQWRVATLPFTSTVNYSNPFSDVSFSATFSNGTASITRAGFWDGGSAFAVRFSGSAGEWAWRTACSNTADSGLHNRSGTLTVAPYASGANPLYAHGPLRVRSDGRRFEHADGAPFRWLGDTAWMSPDLTLLDSCNAPANASCASALRYIIADRVQKGFTVYQTYYFGETGTWWLDPGNFTRLNASAFGARVDTVVAAANEAGLAVALGMGMHSQSVTMPLPALRALAAYTSARYGAHSIVWITAQEGELRRRAPLAARAPAPPRLIFSPPLRSHRARAVNAPNANATAWGVAAQALFDGTRDLGVPLTAHMWVGPNASAPFAPPFVYGDRPFHSWFATQGGHTGMGIRSKEHYASYWNWRSPLSGLPEPFLEAEAMYENITCGPRFAWANDTRAAAWKATLCGSLGFTYGAAAIWLFKRDVEDKTGEAYNPNTWWWPNVALPGSFQVGAMSSALGPQGALGAGWAQLTPRFSDPAWCDFGAEDETTVLASVGDEAFVLYSYGAALDVGTVRGLRAAPAAYAATLLDPRSGATRALGSVTSADGVWRVPPKPDAGDWAWMLVLQQ